MQRRCLTTWKPRVQYSILYLVIIIVCCGHLRLTYCHSFGMCAVTQFLVCIQVFSSHSSCRKLYTPGPRSRFSIFVFWVIIIITVYIPVVPRVLRSQEVSRLFSKEHDYTFLSTVFPFIADGAFKSLSSLCVNNNTVNIGIAVTLWSHIHLPMCSYPYPPPTSFTAKSLPIHL